jgi:tetratricopeptide (TPR) repeat protein
MKALLRARKPPSSKDQVPNERVYKEEGSYSTIQSLLSQNEHALALKLIEEYLKMYPNNYRYRLLQFETYYAMAEFSKALKLIESLLIQNDDLDLMKRIQKLYYKMIKTNIKANQSIASSIEQNVDFELGNKNLILQTLQNKQYFSQILQYEEKQMMIQSNLKYSLFFLSVVKELQIDLFSTFKYPDVELELIKMDKYALDYTFFENIDKYGNNIQWLSKAHSIIKKHIPLINPISITKSSSLESFDVDLNLYQSTKYILFDLKLQTLLLKKCTTKE